MPQTPERRKEYRKENREKRLLQQREWRAKNPRRCKELSLKSRWRQKKRVLEKLGGSRCSACPETDIAVLSIDHIAGDGASERAGRTCGSSGLYDDISVGRRGPEGLRVLCMSCQWRARVYGPETNQWAQKQADLKGLIEDV